MSGKREHTIIHVADNSRGTGTPNQARSAFLSRRKVPLIRYTGVQVVPLHRVTVETTQSFFTEDVTSQSYLIVGPATGLCGNPRQVANSHSLGHLRRDTYKIRRFSSISPKDYARDRYFLRVHIGR